MDLYKFITHEELELAAKGIRNETDFEISKRFKCYRFMIRSSRAGCDWISGVKEGDYIIGIDIIGKDGGTCRPYGGEELKGLDDVKGLAKHIDNLFKEVGIKGYETLDEGQISLFEIMV